MTEPAKATRCTPGKKRSSQNHRAPENANCLEAALTVVLFCVFKLFLHRGPAAPMHLLPDVKEGRGAAERLAPEAESRGSGQLSWTGVCVQITPPPRGF